MSYELKKGDKVKVQRIGRGGKSVSVGIVIDPDARDAAGKPRVSIQCEGVAILAWAKSCELVTPAAA